MKFATTAGAVFALIAAAAASPTPDLISQFLSCPPFGCLTQQQADQFVQRFTGVLTHQGSDLGNFTTTANLLLAEGFQEISGSVNSLAGFPLDAVTTPSKEAYISSVEHAPADNGVNTIFTNVANCRNIIWHWEFTQVGDAKYPVKGFNYFALNQQCQCTQLQLEFNSIAWGLDTGYKLVWPNGTIQS